MKSAPCNLATQYEELLSQIKSQRLDGKLVFEGSGLQKHWTLYFHLGRLVYATGGAHPVRRFKRHIHTNLPAFDLDTSSQALANSSLAEIQKISWDYELLRIWRDQNTISRDQAQQITNGNIQEILLDILQAGQLNYKILPQEPGSQSQFLALNDPVHFTSSVVQTWQRWDQANLVPYYFNDAPVILQPDVLQQKTSAGVYSTLSKLLTGENTLLDLAALRKRDVVEITASIYPYLKENLVALKPIPDYAMPKVVAETIAAFGTRSERVKKTELPAPRKATKPLIACVDDSPLVCQTMERILRGSGYAYLGIQDSLRAVPQLLTHKPALIFLDLVMPHTNGYEVCSQLRKTSLFRDTPIVILTGNDGIVDRVRAKVVGATDFLGKPVDGETVLAVAERYLSAVKS